MMPTPNSSTCDIRSRGENRQTNVTYIPTIGKAICLLSFFLTYCFRLAKMSGVLLPQEMDTWTNRRQFPAELHVSMLQCHVRLNRSTKDNTSTGYPLLSPYTDATDVDQRNVEALPSSPSNKNACQAQEDPWQSSCYLSLYV